MPAHVARTRNRIVGVVFVYQVAEGEMASKLKAKRVRNDYEDDPGISRPKKIPKTLVEKDSEKRLIVILENACLETIKVSFYWVCSVCVCVRAHTCMYMCQYVHVWVYMGTHNMIKESHHMY